MQIVSYEDNLNVMSDLFSGQNEKNIINFSSAELTQRVIKVKVANFATTLQNETPLLQAETCNLPL